MKSGDVAELRDILGALDASSAHAASGESRPTVGEIFAPEHHAGALDPNVSVVLGARGAGKSFWAGVLESKETRLAAAEAYPRLGLSQLDVRFGFTGLSNDGSVSRETIDHLVPMGDERRLGLRLWRCIMLRAVKAALAPDEKPPTVRALMEKYSDPEEWEADCEQYDVQLQQHQKKVLVLFDALDAIAVDWNRLRDLIDSLLEVTWSSRGLRAIRIKLFLRPDQMRDLGLRFVELPKMEAGATSLTWTGTDLYGMLFARLSGVSSRRGSQAFKSVLEAAGTVPAPEKLAYLRRWPPSNDSNIQSEIWRILAGAYMGRSHKKGRTYEWPLNHLADGFGQVTPRSFMTLAISAARSPAQVSDQVLSAESIRTGLREASKVRVDQLGLEFPWIKRVLAPLARLQVPCTLKAIETRWAESETIDAIEQRAKKGEFLPAFEAADDDSSAELLVERLVRIGVLTIRSDNRIDMPDLFRVAARLLKKGGVAPH